MTNDTLKHEGNALFRENRFEDAYAKYSQALDSTKDDAARAVLYSNRAQCCLSLERYATATLPVPSLTRGPGGKMPRWTPQMR